MSTFADPVITRSGYFGVGEADNSEYIGRTTRNANPVDGIYGAIAFGTSAHSSVLTEWPNEGQVGVHGTNEPWLIPGRISHGCIRLRNPVLFSDTPHFAWVLCNKEGQFAAVLFSDLRK